MPEGLALGWMGQVSRSKQKPGASRTGPISPIQRNITVESLTPLLLPIGEAASSIAIGKTKFYELINAGEIRTVKVGRRTLIPRQELIAYVERLCGGPSEVA